IAHAREAELVGRSAPRFRTADTITRVAEISDHSGGARVFRARQASAKQAVILMDAAVAGCMEHADQAVAVQVTVVLPFAPDAWAIWCERCPDRVGSAELAAMADSGGQGRLDARRLPTVGLVVAATSDAATAHADDRDIAVNCQSASSSAG